MENLRTTKAVRFPCCSISMHLNLQITQIWNRSERGWYAQFLFDLKQTFCEIPPFFASNKDPLSHVIAYMSKREKSCDHENLLLKVGFFWNNFFFTHQIANFQFQCSLTARPTFFESWTVGLWTAEIWITSLWFRFHPSSKLAGRYGQIPW